MHDLRSLNFLWLEITPKCNLNCEHCYVSSTPHLPLYGDMSLDNWKAAMNEAYTHGCRRMQFIGGEPTIHPGLPELIEHARKTGFDFIEVFSNGVTLIDKLKGVYVKNRVALAFSVYAPDAKVHDSVTQHTGSFEKTIQTICWAVETGLPLRISVIETSRNAAVIQETCEFLKQIGVGTIQVDRVRGIGRGAQEASSNNPFTELCGHCWKGKLCVTASGKTYPCIMARSFLLGNALESLDSVFAGEQLVAFRERQRQYVRSSQENGFHSDPCNPDVVPCNPDVCGPYTFP